MNRARLVITHGRVGDEDAMNRAPTPFGRLCKHDLT